MIYLPLQEALFNFLLIKLQYRNTSKYTILIVFQTISP